jgi:hypothetical protein
MIIASFQEYLPLAELLEIVAVCIGVAIVAPSAAALVITGFEVRAQGRGRLRGDLRIALGVAVIAVLVVVGLVALIRA